MNILNFIGYIVSIIIISLLVESTAFIVFTDKSPEKGIIILMIFSSILLYTVCKEFYKKITS